MKSMTTTLKSVLKTFKQNLEELYRSGYQNINININIDTLIQEIYNDVLIVFNNPNKENYQKDKVTFLYFVFIQNQNSDFDPVDCMDSGDCSTLDFTLKQNVIDNLYNNGKESITNNKDIILDIIKKIQ